MYGSAGTGKTLILCEALKIKLSQLRSQGRRVRILATGFSDVRTTQLRNNFNAKYLVNLDQVEVMSVVTHDTNASQTFSEVKDLLRGIFRPPA